VLHLQTLNNLAQPLPKKTDISLSPPDPRSIFEVVRERVLVQALVSKAKRLCPEGFHKAELGLPSDFLDK
jgi:hypothetical protein